MKGNTATVKITEGAVIIAAAVVLNFFKLDLGPEGGSVNLVFIPLMVFALRRGVSWGFGAGLVFGVLKAIIGGGIAYGWQSLLLDYAVAYALVGLTGLLPKRPVLGTVIGAAGCLASFVLSGVLIWGEYMPDSFYGLTMRNVWIYSLLYNGSFVVCNELIDVIVIAFLARNTKLLKA